jgi:hypothetical protein
MKKITFLALLLSISLLLSACAVVVKEGETCSADDGVCDTDIPTEEQTTEEPQENIEEETNVVEEVVEEIQKDDKSDIMEKFSKVKTLEYHFEIPSEGPSNNKFYTSKENMKIELGVRTGIIKEDYFDTVYLDLENKEAIAYCEDRDDDVCPDKNKEFEVSYLDYYKRTPFYWIEVIDSYEFTERSQNIEGRNGLEMTFESNGKEGTMFIDSFYYIPLEVEFSGKTYVYKDLGVNTVEEAELTHQTIE